MLQHEDRWDKHWLTNDFKVEKKGVKLVITIKIDLMWQCDETSIIYWAGNLCGVSSIQSKCGAPVALSDTTALCLGFGGDWVVMGGQCWGALCYLRGSSWWAGIGFICSVYRFVFATQTPHFSSELDFFFALFLTSSEKCNSIGPNLIPSAPALDTCSCFDPSWEVELCLCPTKRGKNYSWDEILS